MNYITLKIKDKELKLRLNARATVQLEKKLGKNPMEVFMGVEQGHLPTLADLIIVLHGCLQALEHGYTEDKVYDLFDEYVEDGGSVMDLIPVIVEVFQASGIIPKGEGEEAKN